jgi:pilus assembly protein Flp/PilA
MKLTPLQWRTTKVCTGPDGAGETTGIVWTRAQTATVEQEQPMNTLVKRFVKDQSGATAIEYGLIAAGISVAIIAVVNSLGSQLKATFTTVSSQLATAGK